MLNLGGASMDTSTATGAMIFTAMAALAQMALGIKRERVSDSVTKRRAAGKDLGVSHATLYRRIRIVTAD